jgi:hypothetical protein
VPAEKGLDTLLQVITHGQARGWTVAAPYSTVINQILIILMFKNMAAYFECDEQLQQAILYKMNHLKAFLSA